MGWAAGKRPLASSTAPDTGRRGLRRLGILLALLAHAGAASAAAPMQARGTFVSQTYAFSFRAPAGTTYCRLADDWTGSDHGTILFLTPPSACDGTGYPSISRGFEPEATPRIDVYYGNSDSEIDKPPPCHRVGRAGFLGTTRALCRAVVGGMDEVSVTGYYTADAPAAATVRLVTTPARLRRDLITLRALLASARICSVPWQDAQGHTRLTGSGRACPAEGDFY